MSSMHCLVAACKIRNIQLLISDSRLTLGLHLGLLATPVGRRMFSPKRLVVYTRDGIRTPGILLREGATSGPAPTVHVLEIRTRRDQRDSTDLLPYMAKFRGLFTRLPLQHKKSIVTKAVHVPVSDIEYVHSQFFASPPLP
jgi:antiviral helicase SKI2